MTGLVIFLHGLTGDQHTWGAVPDYVKKSPLGSNFDVATLQYSAKWRSRSTIEKSARRVQTEIETEYPDHDPIFLVGHSLGGLIAREICRHLLVSGPDDLLNKIPAVITVGTPLEGARFWNSLLRRIPFLTPKIEQLADSVAIFDSYRLAIRSANARTVNHPKQLHVQIEDDSVIGSHVRSHFTDDDREAGVIPGTHTNFAKNNDDASYVANVLLTQMLNALNSLSAPFIRKSGHETNTNLPDRLVIIACSHTKRDGGNIYSQANQPAQWIPEPELRQRVISKRSYVYGVLHDAKLADGFERGGNRKHQPANQDMEHGPDFGGTTVKGNEGSYLPAWQRYNGRCYGPITEPAWDKYLENRDRLCVLIMSGLYGLIEAGEWIQNYDVHLTDTHIDTGHSVSSMWSELFTECLGTYVEHSRRARKVNIFNFLCDHHYVDAVQWHKLPGECSVYHLASPTVDDVGLLPPAGTILNCILGDPDILEGLERDNATYPISDFGNPPNGLSDMRVVFESRVGLSKRTT